MKQRPVLLFFLRVLGWLPATFGLWYLIADLIIWPVFKLADIFLSFLLPYAIQSVTQVSHDVKVSVNLAVPTILLQKAGSNPGEMMVLEGEFLIRALLYSYCVPLYTALALATPGRAWARLKAWLLGMMILQLVQAWGVIFNVLKILLFEQGPQVSGILGFGFWSLNGVGLAYQFGYLILPSVAPIVIWIAQNGEYIKQLIPAWSSFTKGKFSKTFL